METEINEKTLEIIKGWVTPNMPIDDPLIICDIKSIEDATSFVIKNWDSLTSPDSYAKEIRLLLTGLQYTKDKLTEIYQSQTKN